MGRGTASAALSIVRARTTNLSLSGTWYTKRALSLLAGASWTLAARIRARPGRSCSLLFSRCACPGPRQHPPAQGAALPPRTRAAARLRGALAWGGLAAAAHGCGCLLRGTRQAVSTTMTLGVAFSRRRCAPLRAVLRACNAALAARACADVVLWRA